MNDLSTDRIAQLETQVQSRLNGRVRDLRLVLQGEGLVLRGHTHTYHAKQLALQMVRESSQLPILANEIEVI